MNNALASEIRIRHPPEKNRVGLVCISPSNPNPNKMRRARDSAEAAPIRASSACTWVENGWNGKRERRNG